MTENAYYADAVKWAVPKGITTGTSDTTFSPDAACTTGHYDLYLQRYGKISCLRSYNKIGLPVTAIRRAPFNLLLR